MKRIIGSVLCLLAILLIVGKMVGDGADTQVHNLQGFAVIGLLLAAGIPLSTAKKKQADHS